MSEKPQKKVKKNNISPLIIVAIITGTVAILTTIISVMSPVIVDRINNPIPTLTPTPTFTPTFTSTATFIPTPTFTLTPYICPYRGQTDNETISNLIQAEAVAANFKDLSIILTIFDPNAIFYDYDSARLKQWNGPIERYQDDLFKTTDLQELEHIDISPVGLGIIGDIAYYVSGSKGNYRIGGGNWTYFFNGSKTSTPSTQFGSEHWILKKNNNGCWIITQMEFNAGHVEFPKLP